MNAETCQVATGFLFTRECGLPAEALCPNCGRRVCDAHLTSTEEGALVCTACAGTATRETEDDASYYYDDYGYYGGPNSFWGQRTSRDPHDFTEADGGSLRHEGDAAFEEDMVGS
ncbi:hypothetical protein LZ198_27390 [Myxococcus sp. K15C18031901]|uniref:hypothetical protein n=1 Tax=Myxococcus dinghuensis TaxID=2906761 RepID=UPI0020A703A5|nr:hypothetical protein [Myxococcus dinghuensis]MCP3102604.1 hypothetical protein [Myxococcus dinghuensis]